MVVLCAGSTLLLTPVVRPANVSGINLQKCFLPPTGRFNLGFILRENLLMCSLYLPFGVSQRIAIKTFLAPLPGRKRISPRGVSHFQSLYFVIVLLIIFLFCLVCFFILKTRKKLVPIIFVIFATMFLV